VAGYSRTPLAKKLGIGEGHRLLLLGAPRGFPRALEPLPAGVEARSDLRGSRPFDVLVLFCPDRRRLERELPRCRGRLNPASGLWIAWPKKASGVPTDLDDSVVRACGLGAGLVDNKVCAIDDVWSGLRFVIRKRDRPR